VAASRTRREKSVKTFGLPGRLLMSALVLLPLSWFWSSGLFGWPGLVIYAVVFLPWAWRDIWRRAPRPFTDLDRLREQSAREARQPEAGPSTSIAERPAPKRW
jgi:hypothetical protein